MPPGKGGFLTGGLTGGSGSKPGSIDNRQPGSQFLPEPCAQRASPPMRTGAGCA
jgi:hypothetical protein